MKMLINGSWCDAKSGEVIEILNPSNSEIIDTVPRGRGCGGSCAGSP